MDAIQELLSETRRWSVKNFSARIGSPACTVTWILYADCKLLDAAFLGFLDEDITMSITL